MPASRTRLDSKLDGAAVVVFKPCALSCRLKGMEMGGKAVADNHFGTGLQIIQMDLQRGLKAPFLNLN